MSDIPVYNNNMSCIVIINMYTIRKQYNHFVLCYGMLCYNGILYCKKLIVQSIKQIHNVNFTKHTGT